MSLGTADRTAYVRRPASDSDYPKVTT